MNCFIIIPFRSEFDVVEDTIWAAAKSVEWTEPVNCHALKQH
jgi:hypothetical protein